MNRLRVLNKLKLLVLFTTGLSSTASFCELAWPKQMYKKSTATVKHAMHLTREKAYRMFPGLKATVKKQRGVALTENETTSFERFKKGVIGLGIVAGASGIGAGYYYDLLSIIFPRPPKPAPPFTTNTASADNLLVPLPDDLPPFPDDTPTNQSSAETPATVKEPQVEPSPAPPFTTNTASEDNLLVPSPDDLPPLPDDTPENRTGQSSAETPATVEEPQAEPPPAPPPPPAPAPSAVSSPAGAIDPRGVTLRHVESKNLQGSPQTLPIQKKPTENLRHIDPSEVQRPPAKEEEQLTIFKNSPVLTQALQQRDESGDDAPSAQGETTDNPADAGAGEATWKEDELEYGVRQRKADSPSDAHTTALNLAENELKEGDKIIARSAAMLGGGQQEDGKRSDPAPAPVATLSPEEIKQQADQAERDLEGLFVADD